jgi:hypothetical protein
MGRYLNALKTSGNGGGTTLINLKNPLDVGCLGSLGTPPPCFEIIQAANDNQKHGDNVPPFGWLIHFTDRDPLTATFSPELNHADALACHTDAVAAEPVADRLKRPLTKAEAEELRQLVAAIYQNGSEADRAEALYFALADPDGALACYAAIASECNLTHAGDDDRRTCRQCANLAYAGVCSIAKLGGVVSAQMGYRPGVMFQEHPHRCEGFEAKP